MKTVNAKTRCMYTLHDTGVALMGINNPSVNALSR